MDPEEWALQEKDLSLKEPSLKDLLDLNPVDGSNVVHRDLGEPSGTNVYLRSNKVYQDIWGYDFYQYLSRDGWDSNYVKFVPTRHDDKQKWWLEPTGWGSFFIQSNGKCLDYDFNAGTAGMHDCHFAENQDWHFIGNSFDDKEIKTALGWKCLDLDLGGSFLDNPRALVYDCNGGSNQRYKIET